VLDRLVRLSQEMLTLAEQGEWEQLATAQSEREQLIEQIFPLDPRISDAADAAAQVKRVLELDQQITQLARAQQKEIGQVLGKLNRGRVATRAYQDTSRR